MYPKKFYRNFHVDAFAPTMALEFGAASCHLWLWFKTMLSGKCQRVKTC